MLNKLLNQSNSTALQNYFYTVHYILLTTIFVILMFKEYYMITKIFMKGISYTTISLLDLIIQYIYVVILC